MTYLIAAVMALHVSGDHGLANSLILAPAALIAAGYYALVGVAGAARRAIIGALSADGARTVSIEGAQVGPGGPLVFTNVRIVNPSGAPAGSVLTMRLVEVAAGPLALVKKRLEIPLIALIGVELSVAGSVGERDVPVRVGSRAPRKGLGGGEGGESRRLLKARSIRLDRALSPEGGEAGKGRSSAAMDLVLDCAEMDEWQSSEELIEALTACVVRRLLASSKKAAAAGRDG